jgi:hypothetical protein
LLAEVTIPIQKNKNKIGIAANDGGFAFVPLTENCNFSTKLQSGITPNPVLALGFKNFREGKLNHSLWHTIK